MTGLNHNTAPVDIRERLAFSEDETGAALDRLARLPQLKEVVLISTCNRVEALMASERPEEAVESVNGFISEFKGIEPARFKGAMYVNKNDAAVRHIFRVAASLDSMMIGEPQILGQIKSAYYMATQKKTSGVILNRLLHRAFFVAKRVRTETGIGDHAVSISHAAVELGKKILAASTESRRC